MSDDKPEVWYEDAHNRGQEDGAKGDYKPPGLIDRPMMTHSLDETIEAYDKGFENGQDSKK